MRSLILSFLILSSLLFGIFDVNGTAYFPPPLKQISHGVPPENVTCTDGLVLVIKKTNNLPACVHLTSMEILIQRGWAMNPFVSLLDSQNFHLSNVNDEYKIVEKAQAILNHVLEKEQSESLGEYIEGPTDDGYEIVFYNVSQSNIILNKLPQLPFNLLHWQQDKEKHHEIWNIFTKLIPENQRNVSVFYITTDGVDGVSGGVERDVDDMYKWHLFYDIFDAYPIEVIDDKEIIYTTIHEFGHIVTSGPDQIDVDLELVNLWDSDIINEEEQNELFQLISELCHPKTMVVDGCAKTDSYINLFNQKFWADIISDWDEIQYIEDDEEFYEQSDLFYEKFQDRFVSIYSSTNIDEDIAESWTAFVLKDKPKGETISEQKILFFYDFSELVDIREHIRKGLV
ncbi:MAG: hypothetical protein OEL52_02385 [Nitrosopumilus sp.]|nr:hypothetical protein [Nitrosopumilus sp.]